MNKLDRRSFLKSSLLTTASLSLFPALGAENAEKRKAGAPAASHATGANSDVRFAVVGFNGRGMSHIEGLRAVEGARMVALCDVDQHILDREVKKYRDLGEKIEAYTDVRKLLENKGYRRRQLLRRRTIGTRSEPSGRCRRARMCMSRSRSRTTCGKEGGLSKLLAS